MQQLLSVLATVVLARLLSPADFGVVAAAMSMLAFFYLASAFGFGASIVRRTVVEESHLRSILAANLIAAFVLTIGGALAAPFVARLIGSPDASWAIAAIMPSMIMVAVGGVSEALLQRQLRFQAMSLLGIGATVTYVAVELGLAALGFGYWSVVMGFLAMQLLQNVGLVVLAGWRPRLASPGRAFRQDGRFSGEFFVNELMQYFNKNLDYWLVGGLLGAPALGAYYIAYTLPSIVRLRFSSVVQSVLFPVFSRLRGDRDKSQRLYIAAMGLQAAVGIPTMLGLAVVAEPVVRVFFGAQWADSVDPMRWIALAAALDLLSTALSQAAMAFGLMRRNVFVAAGRAICFAIALGVAAFGSLDLTAVAIAVFISSLAGLVLNQRLIGAPIGFRLGQWVGACVRVCAISAAMAAIVAGVLQLAYRSGASDLAALVVAVPAGVLSYLVLGAVFARREFRTYLNDIQHILGVRRVSSRA
jgi:PST family polysaccharide transporter